MECSTAPPPTVPVIMLFSPTIAELPGFCGVDPFVSTTVAIVKGVFFRMRSNDIESLDLIRKKTPFTIATVVETKGSTPQKPGSSAIVGENNIITGTVGGGAVEHSIQKKASEVINSK